MLKGKTAVITGGGRGIGRAVALEFAAGGADIAILYRSRREEALSVKSEAEALGVRCEIYACDVSDYNACAEVSKNIAEAFGKIDILVNNAGIVRDGLLMRMKEEDFDAVIGTNLKGAFNMTRNILPLMIRARTGRIINLSSVIGLTGNAGQSNYAAAKAGIIGFTKSVAKEAGSRGITCNAIAPGFIDTEMTGSLKPEIKEQLCGQIPLRRTGKPDEVAALAAFLASDAAAYITGECIRVDGGLAT